MKRIITKGRGRNWYHLFYKLVKANLGIDAFLTVSFPEKRVLVSTSSGSESDTGRNERKRIHSESDSEGNEVPKPAKVAKTTKTVQKSISSFRSGGENSALPAASSSSLEGEQAAQFKIDCVIEVYRFGHTKFHYKRHTILCSSLLSKPLVEFKKSVRQLYGVEQDARRANIGSHEIDAGICGRTADGSLPTFTAKTEAEWQNLVSRIKSQLQQYMLLSE